MKKTILKLTALLMAVCILSSCATVFGGKIDQCQKTKPVPGTPVRSLRVVPFVANIILFWPAVFIDLGTGAAYKPCKK